MGVTTVTIMTCDRCNVRIHDELTREHPQNGETHVSWHGHEGGLTWQGDAGGYSFDGKALLCHRCANAFLEFMKPSAATSQGSSVDGEPR